MGVFCHIRYFRLAKAASLFVFIFSNIIFIRASFGLEKIDELSGEEQKFTPGYAPRVFGEAFHSEAVYGPQEIPYGFEEAVSETPTAKEVWRRYRKFGFATAYDSNVFRTRIDPKDDVIYIYRSTLGTGRREKLYYVRLFYNIAYSDYVENEKLSNFSHSQLTQFGYTFNRLTINVSNGFSPRGTIAVGERTELGSPGSRVTAISDKGSFDINYKISPKTTVSFLYGYNLFYLPRASNPSAAVSFGNQTHTFGPRISYQAAPKTKVYAQYLWETVDFFEDQAFKYRSTTPSVGISGRINPKTTYALEAGFRTREYKDRSFSSAEGFTLRTALFRKITEKIAGSVYMLRDITEDLDRTRSTTLSRETESYGINLTWRMAPRLSLDADALATFASSEGFITLIDPENDRLTFTREPEDEIYQWSVGLNWNPRPYVVLFLGYKYLNKNSSFKNPEYDQHKAVGSIEGRF